MPLASWPTRRPRSKNGARKPSYNSKSSAACDSIEFRVADPAEQSDAIRRHLRAFGYGEEALRDPGHELVRLTGATVTPEVAVFVADASGLRLVYRGRIDDRAVDFGRTRPAPRVRDLEQVLEALVSGQAVPARTTTATGCFIPELK